MGAGGGGRAARACEGGSCVCATRKRRLGAFKGCRACAVHLPGSDYEQGGSCWRREITADALRYGLALRLWAYRTLCGHGAEKTRFRVTRPYLRATRGLSHASLDHLAQPAPPVCQRAWTAAGGYGWTGETLWRVFGAGAWASACISVLAWLVSWQLPFGALRRAFCVFLCLQVFF